MGDTQEKYINKPFNIRPLCLWAFFVFLTVLACYLALSVGWWVVLLWFVVLVGGFIALNIAEGTFKDNVLKYLSSSRMFFATSIVLCLLVVLSFGVTHHIHSSQRTFEGQGDLRGVVRIFRIDEDGRGSFTISEASFDGRQVRGRVRVTVFNLSRECVEMIESGNVVSISTDLRPSSPSRFSINNRIRYVTSFSGRFNSVEFVGESTDLRSITHRHTHGFLRNTMSEDSTTVIFSMLFGDRNRKDDDMREAFSATGLAHVMAVSGLHVGLLIAMLLLVLKKLRVERKWQLVLIIPILIFYMYVCDFRIPIVRATVMFFTFFAMRLMVRRADFLSCISLAWIITLILFPWSLFSLSFQLSFACMFGIAFFSRPFSRGFNYILPGKRAVNVSCAGMVGGGHQLMHIYDHKNHGGPFRRSIIHIGMLDITTFLTTFPFILLVFGSYPVIGLIANITLLPLLVIAYKLALIAVVTWVGFPLLYIVDWIIWICLRATDWMAQVGRIQITATGNWHLLYLVGLIFTTRFIFLKKRYKYPIAAVLIVAYFVSLLVLNL